MEIQHLKHLILHFSISSLSTKLDYYVHGKFTFMILNAVRKMVNTCKLQIVFLTLQTRSNVTLLFVGGRLDFFGILK